MQVFKDKNVNDLVFAIIVGFATVEFISSSTQILGFSYPNSQDGQSSPIQWHQLLLSAIGFIVALIVALIIRKQLSPKS